MKATIEKYNWDNVAKQIAEISERGAQNGTVVGQATVTDADEGDVHTYSLSDDADGRFSIDEKTGEITLTNGASLNANSADGHEVTVKVTDSSGESYEESFKSRRYFYK